MKHLGNFLLFMLLTCLITTKLNSQIIFLPGDSTRFVTDKIDSIFILAENIAVTASGENLQRLQFQNNEIIGKDLPPILKVIRKREE